MIKEEKNKIEINRKTLTTEQVREKENIDSILSKHKMITKRPVYKQRKYYLALLLIFVVGILMYYADREEKGKKTTRTENSN